MAEVQRSHIEANVPPAEQFEHLMKKGLKEHLQNLGSPNITGIEYELLRQQPTQTGIAYPKYYVWVRANAGKSLLREGAARVAAIERRHLQVTDFVSREEIKSHPEKVGLVFPAALVESIKKRAEAK